ncbi:hypothetical protein LguiB_002600 [Lonicera macranthoides]
MATASKKMIVLGLGFGFLLLFSLMVMPTDAAGRSISYGTLGSKDVILSYADHKKTKLALKGYTGINIMYSLKLLYMHTNKMYVCVSGVGVIVKQ